MSSKALPGSHASSAGSHLCFESCPWSPERLSQPCCSKEPQRGQLRNNSSPCPTVLETGTPPVKALVSLVSGEGTLPGPQVAVLSRGRGGGSSRDPFYKGSDRNQEGSTLVT